jgi:hypothetical protein
MSRAHAEAFLPTLEPVSKDLIEVRARYEAMHEAHFESTRD